MFLLSFTSLDQKKSQGKGINPDELFPGKTLGFGDVDPVLSYPEAVRSLTPENLREAAQTYLSPEAFGVVIVRPG
ncbi:MAG: hypothetical protein JJU32_02350 [Phormidium sp. BM_Day4_Bin.17]|nr:hypothetical protein [Phormidium sp. BM_Day4_Bin.17]UCJ10940.1 MAG: hypothetical protein JWS08_14080 [Phormidium sp. PBR-2020]